MSKKTASSSTRCFQAARRRSPRKTVYCPFELPKRFTRVSVKAGRWGCMRKLKIAGMDCTLAGRELKAGERAPDLTVVGNDLKPVSLTDLAGKTVILSVVPSLDTPTCDKQTRRFNEEAARLP